MKLKLIIALVTDDKTDTVTEATRRAGATGCTVINHAPRTGAHVAHHILRSTLEGQCDVVLFRVELHLSRHILETIARERRFDEDLVSGTAF
jgi:hypothetical protein